MTRTIFLLAPLLVLAGCEHYDRDFGDATRNNMAVQSVQPAPPPAAQPVPGNGAVAAGAQDRYVTDKVKQPATVTTSRVAGSGGNSGSGQ